MALHNYFGLRSRESFAPATYAPGAKEGRGARQTLAKALLVFLAFQLGKIGVADGAFDVGLCCGAAGKCECGQK